MSTAEKNPAAQHPEFQQSLQRNLQSVSKTATDRTKADLLRRTSTADSAPLVEDVDHIDLEEHGIHGIKFDAILRNPSVPKLYEYALKYEKGSKISSTGALMCRSGDKTGRSPKDKRIVKEDVSEKDVWWGRVNMPMEERSFLISRERAIDYLNTQQHLFVVDGYAGWDEKYRMKIRVICSRAYHALFMYNMLIRPKNREELAAFGHPDFVIYNAGAFPANKYTKDVASTTSVSINLKERQMVILGTQYAGEMKKGIFSVMHYFLPKQGVLSLHSSANEGPHGDLTLFFGLSGTGKTTLSADPRRKLIGDDEHGWSDKGVFNIEGGCYAKCINLSAATEPEIYGAIKFGTVLENVEFDPYSREVDYNSAAITENTRSSYPIEYIPNAKVPCVGGHPKNIILLSCDAFGVLPPVSKLTPEQAMYYFISGYTAKVAGTEVGVTEPTAAFSACFGDAFLVLHPSVYAEMLAAQIRKHNATVWLLNTGWNGGPYGVGSRIKLRYTRAMVDAIHSGELEKAETWEFPLFKVKVPKKCTGVPDEVLDPHWQDKEAYDKAVNKLAAIFVHNFKQYEDKASPEIKNAGPQGVVLTNEQIRIAVGMG